MNVGPGSGSASSFLVGVNGIGTLNLNGGVFSTARDIAHWGVARALYFSTAGRCK